MKYSIPNMAFTVCKSDFNRNYNELTDVSNIFNL